MAVMKDVAKLAGVSLSTVSFVLNGTAKEHKVADATARRVILAAKQLGYKINTQLSHQAPKAWQPTITFFTPSSSAWMDMSVIYAAINKHMEQTKRYYNVLLCPYETGKLLDKLDQVEVTAVDVCVVSIENERDWIELENQTISCPVVLYNHASEKYSGVQCLAEDAIRQVVEMIQAKGYQEICILSGNHDWKNGDDYLNTFINSCNQNDIVLEDTAFISTKNSMTGGAIAARAILNMEVKPQIIICMDAVLAFGAIPLLARNNFLIPRDAELLCFGSSGDAEHIRNYIPSLSMIARPLDQITSKAFDIALSLTEEKEISPIHYSYPCDLLLHDSFSF